MQASVLEIPVDFEFSINKLRIGLRSAIVWFIPLLTTENGRHKTSLRFGDSFPGLPLHSIWPRNRDHRTFEVGGGLLRSSFWSTPPVQAGSPNYCGWPQQWLWSVRFWVSPGIGFATSLDNLFYTQVVIWDFYWDGNSCFKLCPLPLLVSVSATDNWLSVIDYQLTLCKNNSLPHWKCISHCNSNSYELAQERQATRSIFLVISFPCWHLVKQTLQKNI